MASREDQGSDTLGRIRIRAGGPDDLTAIRRLLQDCDLPHDDPALAECRFLLGEVNGRLVCCGGLEVRGSVGLLRSVAVAPQARGSGLGMEMTLRLLQLAESLQLNALYLLTTTAAEFFARFGFQTVQREAVPVAIRNTTEFRSICPTTATVMMRSVSSHRAVACAD